MKQLIGISILMLCYTIGWTSNDIYEEANVAYMDGNYSASIELYESLLEKGVSSTLFYNLANAYYKTGRFPEAILFYEKTLRIAPNDKDAIYNLKIANLQLKDKIEATPEFFLLTWWKQFAKKQKANRWTTLFFSFLWLSLILFLLFALTNLSLKRLLFFGGCGSLLLSILFLLLTITQHQYETNNHQAIIMASNVAVKSAPLNTGKDLFIIHSGLKVNILKEENDWLNIRLADGKEGWVTSEALANI